MGILAILLICYFMSTWTVSYTHLDVYKRQVVVRYQGGNNAGHTVVAKQQKFVLNLLPSGILHENVICVLGDGMVVDLEHLTNEIAQIRDCLLYTSRCV